MDLFFSLQMSFGNPLLQIAHILQQFGFTGFADRAILFFATFTAAEDVDFISFFPPLDLHFRFLLEWIPGRWPSNHLFPIVLLQFVQPFISFRLQPRNKVVQPSVANLFDVFVKGHASIDNHSPVRFLPCAFLENIQHLVGQPSFRFAIDTITNEIVLDRLASECDVIFHLAAAVGVKLIVKNPVQTIETNVMGTEAVLKVAQRYRVRVLIASTSEVYGKGNSIPFREEDDVYDRLATSVSGDLLTEIYLQNRKSLVVTQAGGARARVKEVEILDVEVNHLKDPPLGLLFRANWTAMGSVGHWGHIHIRKNQYEADITVEPMDGAWKITNLDLIQEKRIDFYGQQKTKS